MTKECAMKIVKQVAYSVYEYYATHDYYFDKGGDKVGKYLHAEITARIQKIIEKIIVPAFEVSINQYGVDSIEEWSNVAARANSAFHEIEELQDVFAQSEQIQAVFARMLPMLGYQVR